MHYFTNRTRLRAAFYAGALALPIGAATPALAQDQADSNGATEVYANSATNREIVVTALTSLARLDREDARKSQAESSNTGAILGNVPGVSVNSGGGFSGMPAIRGLNQQRISITVDGQTIDLSCPNDMNSPLSYTDPHTVGQIDVLTGVAPVSFGGDQIGGIIKVESPAPRFSNSGKLELSGEASSFYRSNGDGFGGGVTLTAAGEHLSATYSGSFTQSDNYDAGGNGGMVRFDGQPVGHLNAGRRRALGLAFVENQRVEPERFPAIVEPVEQPEVMTVQTEDDRRGCRIGDGHYDGASALHAIGRRCRGIEL